MNGLFRTSYVGILGVTLLGQLAAAQVPEPFTRMFPLHVGDRWDYAVASHESTENGPVITANLGRERWTVEDVEQSGTRTTATLRQRRWAADGSPISAALCRMSRIYTPPPSGSGHLIWLEMSSLENQCSIPGIDSTRFRIWSAFGGPLTYEIGGVPYDFEMVAPWSEGGHKASAWSAGNDVGLLRVLWSQSDSVNYRDTTLELAYAQVNGVEYGNMPVANDHEARPANFALKSVFPNPFRDFLRIDVQQPDFGALTIELFDLLGRLVATAKTEPGHGLSEVALDVRALARGSYILRVMTPNGAALTHRVTRVE